MAIEVTPVGYRVLVQRLAPRSLGNIALPDNTKNATFFRFKVVAVGTAKVLPSGATVEIPVKIGDEVLCDFGGAALCGPSSMFEGRELAIIDVDNIYAVMRGEPEPMAPKIVVGRIAPPNVKN